MGLTKALLSSIAIEHSVKAVIKLNAWLEEWPLPITCRVGASNAYVNDSLNEARTSFFSDSSNSGQMSHRQVPGTFDINIIIR